LILVALGANLPSRYGTPDQTLAAALSAMEKAGLSIVKCSRIWLTAPVPVSDQPWYHNAVARVETPLSAFSLLELLQNIENDFGRIRMARNAARILDLDLIAHNGQILDKPELIVPHPRLHERAFVLKPLQEIAPEWVHPLRKKSLTDMISALPPGQEAQPMPDREKAHV
jgi:2-amino-4-hydroxy-6-hydroxymethyldihydropteridine diphosphokinase